MNNFIIFDTEYTSWKGCQEYGWDKEKGQYRELVQLAAVRVDGDSLGQLDTFDEYAKPCINPTLSGYFKDLTGIRQSDVDTARLARAVITDLLEWTGGLTCWSYGDDRTTLQENYGEGALDAITAEQFQDIRPIFQEHGVPVERYNSGTLHQYFGIDMEGTAHNALFDCESLRVSYKTVQR